MTNQYQCRVCNTLWGISLNHTYQLLLAPGPGSAPRWPLFYSEPLTNIVPRCCTQECEVAYIIIEPATP